MRMTKRASKRTDAAKAHQADLRVVSSPSNPEDQSPNNGQPLGGPLKWDEGARVATNFAALGERLTAGGDLFRNGSVYGLVLVRPGGQQELITRGPQLEPIIVDRVDVRVVKDGKDKGGRIPATQLNSMLRSERFLREFRPVDTVTSTPMYLPDFTLTKEGYNDGGEGRRIFYRGGTPSVSESLETINQFLDVMPFTSEADRTNAVAAALTVMLRNHWGGGKPIVLVTSTKSHGGKGTIMDFATGVAQSILVSFQSTDWAFEQAIREVSEKAGVVVIDNARLSKGERQIASACLERITTDPEPFIFSAKGGSVRIRNDLVFAVTTNFGQVSEDIMNRSISIHLNPVGDLASRRPSIGNPKLEFLPAHKEQIAAELRGMIERWKTAGQPLDEDVCHPFGPWAKVVGGILKVSGFNDFLANYGERKTADDPVRRGLGLLGAYRPDKWLPSSDWVKVAVELGLVKTVVPEADRENKVSRARGMGTVLHAHRDETFEVETESERLVLKLEQRRGRFGSESHNRWRFDKLATEPLPVDSDPDIDPPHQRRNGNDTIETVPTDAAPHTGNGNGHAVGGKPDFVRVPPIDTSEDEYVEDNGRR